MALESYCMPSDALILLLLESLILIDSHWLLYHSWSTTHCNVKPQALKLDPPVALWSSWRKPRTVQRPPRSWMLRASPMKPKMLKWCPKMRQASASRGSTAPESKVLCLASPAQLIRDWLCCGVVIVRANTAFRPHPSSPMLSGNITNDMMDEGVLGNINCPHPLNFTFNWEDQW